MRQVRVVKRCEEALSKINGQEIMRRKNHVILGAAGLQFGEELLVAWKGIVGDFHPEFLFESWNGVKVDIVFPVIDEQLLTLLVNPFQHLQRRVSLSNHLAPIEPHDRRQQRRCYAQDNATSNKSTSGQALLPQRLGPDVELCTRMPVHISCSLVVIAVLQASSRLIVGVMPDEKHGLAVACRVVYIVVDNTVHGEATPQLHAHGRINNVPGKDFSYILFNRHGRFISAKTCEEPAGHVPTQVETANQVPACLIQTSGQTAPAIGG